MPMTFVILTSLVRILQGYGDSLTINACLSVVSLTFPEDRAAKLGIMEAAFSTGWVIGPSLGSFLYGMFDYQKTFVFFSLLPAVFGVMCLFTLPDSVNYMDENESEASASSQFEAVDETARSESTEVDQMDELPMNLFKVSDVGIVKVLFSSRTVFL